MGPLRRAVDPPPFLLLTAGLLGAAVPAPLHSQTLSGTLLSMDGDRPIASGQVELLAVEDAELVAVAVTGENGRFEVTAPEPGIYIVRGQAPFHHPMVDGPVELAGGQVFEVEFRLTPSPVALEGIEVEGERRNPRLELEGFYRRKDQGVGHFLTREEIDRRNAMRTAHLFNRIPRAWVMDDSVVFPSSAMYGALIGEGMCAPRIYVDGMLFSGGQMGPQDRSIDEIAPEEIEAMEVYTSAARAPTRYAMDSSCGVILIWLRRARSRRGGSGARPFRARGAGFDGSPGPGRVGTQRGARPGPGEEGL